MVILITPIYDGLCLLYLHHWYYFVLTSLVFCTITGILLTFRDTILNWSTLSQSCAVSTAGQHPAITALLCKIVDKKWLYSISLLYLNFHFFIG